MSRVRRRQRCCEQFFGIALDSLPYESVADVDAVSMQQLDALRVREDVDDLRQILVAFNLRLSIGLGVLAVVSAIVPYATIPMEIWLHRKGWLKGDWRLEESDHPQDRTWYDRTMRWFLRRAWFWCCSSSSLWSRPM
ncbi:hypothetical protein ACTU6V_02705 [Microbacterium sp. A204]|uniref:hypothetical protein n=1 Tax=Microbacterium sp. A204 TaxID=3457321 RepID=UPI003FCFA32F